MTCAAAKKGKGHTMGMLQHGSLDCMVQIAAPYVTAFGNRMKKITILIIKKCTVILFCAFGTDLA